jgi:hypothetical protein
MISPSSAHSTSPIYAGNGVATAFATTFIFIDNAEVKVMQISPDGAESQLVSGFTVTGAKTLQGTVTFSTPVANGFSVYFVRVTTAGQPVSVRNGGRFNPILHEEAWDRLALQTQEAKDAAKGVGLLDFVQTGGIARPSTGKLREVSISVKDYAAAGNSNGTAGNGTNDRAAIVLAVTAAAGRKVTFPPGVYRIATSYTAPAGSWLHFEAGARILPDAGQTFSSLGTLTYDDQPVEPLLANQPNTFLGKVGTERVTSTAAGTNDKYNFRLLWVDNESVDQSVAGSKVNGYQVYHSFGGSAAKGGRHAIEGVLLHTAATNSSNADRNYVGVQGQVICQNGDGGTAPSPKGGYFGMSTSANISGGTHVFNLSGIEVNTGITAGAGTRVNIHTGMQIASLIGERGYGFDCAISVSCLSGLGWKYGIGFTGLNGRVPFDSDSVGIHFSSAIGTMSKGIEFDGVSCTNGLLTSTNTKIFDGVIRLESTGSALELGAKNSNNTPFIDFNSSGLNFDYDSRLIAVGGSGSVGNGSLAVTAASFRSATDNTTNLGTSSNRWATVYAGTGTINTSDAREKTLVRPLSAAETEAAKQIARAIGGYRFLSSIAEKGDKAREHIGLTVQRAIEILEGQGLDPYSYGFICYDKWDAQEATFDQDGRPVLTAREAGDRYSFRMDELCMFVLAGIEARLSAAGI